MFQTVCRTGIFFICAQTLVQLRPEASYEKYLKLLVGAMVLLQLFAPVGNALAGENGVSPAESLKALWESMEQSMEEARERALQAQKRLEQTTLQEAARRIKEQEQSESSGETNAEKPLAEQKKVKPVEPVTIEPVEAK